MAGTRFNQGDLAREVEANYNAQIQKVVDKLFEQLEESHDKAHALWRTEAAERVHLLHRRILSGEATDTELSRFSISSPPDPYGKKYAVTDFERQKERLEAARDKALAYIRSLAPVDVGGQVGDPIRPNIVEVSAIDLKRIGYGV